MPIKKSQQLAQDLKTKREEFKAFYNSLLDTEGNLKTISAEDDAKVNAFETDCANLEAEYQKVFKLENAMEANEKGIGDLGEVKRTMLQPSDTGEKKFWDQDFRVKRYASLRNFPNTKDGERAAYALGRWYGAAIIGVPSHLKWCKDNGIPIIEEKELETKGSTEGSNTGGGFLVPPEFDTFIIDLREVFGVVRRIARIKRMTRDVVHVSRRTSGLTAYFPGEATAATESTKGWDQIQLVAKKPMVLTRMSSEIDEDAMINLGDDLAGEIAYAFSEKEDQCGINGDGTSSFAGIFGIIPKIQGLSGTVANIAGIQVAAGNLWSEFLMTDFSALIGKLPAYADTPNTRFVTHRTFYFSVMEQLAIAAGGTAMTEVLQGGGRVYRFRGYPVEFAQVMPKTDANSQVAVLFGDFQKGMTFGDRRQTTIARSSDRYFDTDEIGIRGTERFDINVHDVGNASATASLRVPGPIVAMQSAAA